MQQEQFDRWMKETLEQREVPYQPAHWEQMREMLGDGAEAFDDSFRTTLGERAPKYQPTHWQDLRQRMDRKGRRIGLFLILAIFLGWGGVWVLHQPLEKSPFVSSNTSIQDANGFRTEENKDSDNSTAEMINSFDSVAALEHTLTGTSEISNHLYKTNSNSTKISHSGNATDHSRNSLVVVQSKHTISNDESETFISQPVLPQSIEINNQDLNSKRDHTIIPGIGSFQPNLIWNALQIYPTKINLPWNTGRRFRHHFGLYYSSDLNYVNSPYDTDFQLNGYHLYESGFSLGAMYQYDWTRALSGRVGLEYNVKTYVPRLITEYYEGGALSGYYAQTLTQIQFQAASCPVDLVYQIVHQPRWQVYTTIGLTPTVNLMNHYKVEKYYTGAATDPNPKYPPPSDESVLLRKDFDPGILQGGSSDQNFQLAFQGGVGLQYRLPSTQSIFWEAQYRPVIYSTGLGPFQDRINTFSVKLGYSIGF